MFKLLSKAQKAVLKRKIINHIIKIEGGYVNDPSDSGGETKYGITVAVARDYGYTGRMIDLPKSLAFNIYADRYWHSVLADKLPALIATEVVDTAVNLGVSRASKFLQRSLNLLTNHKLVVDGHIGNATIRALEAYTTRRSEVKILSKMLNALQGAFYIDLAERRPKDVKYIYGWFKWRVE